MIAYYPFNGNANDESGNGNHGTVHGASLTSDKSGKPNSAYFFDGENDFIDIGNATIFDVHDEITFSSWFKLPIGGKLYTRKWKTETSCTGSWQVRADNSTQTFVISGNGSSGNYSEILNNVLDMENFHHIAGTYNASDNKIRLFIDGIEISTADGQPGSIYVSNAKIYIGASIYNSRCPIYPNDYTHGIIDEVQIYNRALSEDEIWMIYNQPGASAGPDKIICNQICDEVVLDGRKSYDPNGEIVSYEWELDHQEDLCDNFVSGETPTVTDLCPGTYDVTLTVTDDEGLIAMDKMVLTILETCDPCAIMQGDFDSDGDVDGDDLKIFSGNYGTMILTP